MKDKLNGKNPVRIMITELMDSVHGKRAYYAQLTTALKGPKGSVRVAQKDRAFLTVEE